MTPFHRLLGTFILVLGICFPHAAHAIANGSYQIVAKHSDKCVDVSGVSGSNGAKVHQWRCHSGDNQKWRVSAMDGGYRVQAVHSGKCLVFESAAVLSLSISALSATSLRPAAVLVRP